MANKKVEDKEASFVKMPQIDVDSLESINFNNKFHSRGLRSNLHRVYKVKVINRCNDKKMNGRPISSVK